MSLHGHLKRCVATIRLLKVQVRTSVTGTGQENVSVALIPDGFMADRTERFISYVETDLNEHYDDMVTVKFNKIDRKVVSKQDLQQIRTYVFAPNFDQFMKMPQIIHQSDAESMLETFCVQPAEDGVRWSRSLMGQRFGYKLGERAAFPDCFPFFIVNVQPKVPGKPFVRLQLVKMARAGRPDYEYAYPSIYYYDKQDWTCLLRKKFARRPQCSIGHTPTEEDYYLGLFAVPCGDFVACAKHTKKFLFEHRFEQWLSRERHPVTQFDTRKTFACPWCDRLSITATQSLEFEYPFRSFSPTLSKNLLVSLWSDWIKWMSRSKMRQS